jgi:hypothetical protein
LPSSQNGRGCVRRCFPLTGGAELRLGEELRVSGRLVLIARGRLAGDTPTSSAFWLLF